MEKNFFTDLASGLLCSLKIPIKKDRPSPSESATLFKVNTKKKGNDGKMYVVVVNKNGVKRWKKID